MGITPAGIALLTDLCREKKIRRGDAILDIGASELFCSDNPEPINELLRVVGAQPYSHEELQQIANRSMAAGLFRRAGYRYRAIDYANFPGIIRRDLNKQGLPWWHRGRCSFVMNWGTSEHILNQYNVFKVIHDACAAGGIMYHGVPGWGDYEHGIIEYSPKFFWSLATDNDYEILMFRGVLDSDEPVPLKPDFVQQIKDFPRVPYADRVYYSILLRKRGNGAFKGLNDPAFDPQWTSPRHW